MFTALFASGENIIAGDANGVYLSSDNGVSWNMIGDLGVSSLVADSQCVCTTTGESVSVSTDNGSHWTVAETGLREFIVTAVAIGNGKVVAAELERCRFPKITAKHGL